MSNGDPAADVTSRQLVELAARHGLDVDADSVRINEAGLDYRVAFVRVAAGEDWVLRVPRRLDVSTQLAEEQRILEFIGPRLSVGCRAGGCAASTSSPIGDCPARRG